MKKTEKQMMAELYEVYKKECPNVKINYETYDITKTQAHICLDGWIEIIHFTNYQGGYAIKFAIVRGIDEFFFDTYADAVKYSSMPIDEFNEYVLSITL